MLTSCPDTTCQNVGFCKRLLHVISGQTCGSAAYDSTAFFTQPKEPQSSRSHRPSMPRPQNRPDSAPQKKPSQIDLLAQEEEFKRLNAELEAKTTELVRQAEEVMVKKKIIIWWICRSLCTHTHTRINICLQL
uniref:Uncharacterized protein n=1 Tax=Electrophorus electricus TaxID=8005 RepID=A0A4W4GP33_ELEEL